MKIRILGNSIRFRLSQTEVQLFDNQGEISDKIQFGLSTNDQLRYSLKQVPDSDISASFINNHIKVSVPQDIGKQWFTTNQIGFQTIIDLGNDSELKILVEKDFKCLTERAGEDESDNFPNPNENC